MWICSHWIASNQSEPSTSTLNEWERASVCISESQRNRLRELPSISHLKVFLLSAIFAFRQRKEYDTNEDPQAQIFFLSAPNPIIIGAKTHNEILKLTSHCGTKGGRRKTERNGDEEVDWKKEGKIEKRERFHLHHRKNMTRWMRARCMAFSLKWIFKPLIFNLMGVVSRLKQGWKRRLQAEVESCLQTYTQATKPPKGGAQEVRSTRFCSISRYVVISGRSQARHRVNRE